jgi:radical SAM/Cys-rich protein
MHDLDISPSFAQKLLVPLKASGIETLQVNLGYRCNLKCQHCHVEAGPRRTQIMSKQVMDQCLQILQSHPIPIVDITGGTPEMHESFPWFLQECAGLNRRLLVRTNAVILLEKGYEGFVDLYARHNVEAIVSLPHLDAATTNEQRGEGVFPRIIEALRRLNDRGYGQPDSGLIVNLVHNPGGADIPGSQACLESQYRQTLQERYGVFFNHLFCLANMPIGRYLQYLHKTDSYKDYMHTLVNAFNPLALERVMCKKTLSVAWDGSLYDCDFNQMLGLTTNHGAPDNILAFDFDKLSHREIVTGNHCYGCTASAGSSCQGAVI